MYRPKNRWEWFQIAIIAIAVFVAISLPVYVVRTIHSETQHMVSQMVRINSLTITCLVDQGQEISRLSLQRCINEGLEIIENGN